MSLRTNFRDFLDPTGSFFESDPFDWFYPLTSREAVITSDKDGTQKIFLDAPGYKFGNVEVDGRILRVEGRLDESLKESSKKETFQWSIALRAPPNPEDVSASSLNGVLVITVGGQPQKSKIKQIPVKTS